MATLWSIILSILHVIPVVFGAIGSCLWLGIAIYKFVQKDETGNSALNWWITQLKKLTKKNIDLNKK